MGSQDRAKSAFRVEIIASDPQGRSGKCAEHPYEFIISSPGLKSDILCGKTGLPAATSRFIAYLVQSRYNIIPSQNANCKPFFRFFCENSEFFSFPCVLAHAIGCFRPIFAHAAHFCAQKAAPGTARGRTADAAIYIRYRGSVICAACPAGEIHRVTFERAP